MNKNLALMAKFLLFIALIISGQMAFAAKITDETVKTKFINLPDIPIDGLDASTVQAYLYFKDMKLLKKELATTTGDEVCNVLNKKLGLKGPYTNHFYKISYSDPDPILLLKTPDGTVIYARSVNPGISPEDRFGTGCMSSQKSLDEALAKNNMTYNPSIFKNKMKKETQKDIEESLKTLLVPEYSKTKFKLYSAKGEGYDDLNKALEMSLAAYERMNESPMTAQDKESLKKAIELWEKALQEADLNDEDARIPRKLAIDLNHNIAMNYMAIGDFQQSMVHLQNIKRIWAGSSFSGFSVDPDRDMEIAMARDRRYRLSPETAADTQAFLARIDELSKASKSIPISIPESSYYDDALASLQGAKQVEMEANINQQINIQEATASSNPFEDKIQKTLAQGYTLFLMPFVTPEYDSFPKEICDLTQLNEIYLTRNNVKSIPPEVGKLKNLIKLTLSSNQIESIPAEIGQLENLEKLDLSKNKLTALPPEIQQLKKLKNLNIKNNNISTEEITKIKSWLPKTRIKK